MKSSPFPARQVHLDFHTSEHIPGVGSRFNKRQFQEALKTGRVNSINIFAKCHHGWSYYPTKVGAKHPTLTIDLLGQQIDACHEIGVRCPIYLTVGWSARDAEQHPEWCVHSPAGEPVALNVRGDAKPGDTRPPTSWVFLCPSGEYRASMLAQTRELCSRYDVDGLWYDITCGPVCHCVQCRAGMKKEGVDPSDESAAAAYNTRKWMSFMEAAKQTVASKHPRATVFFNGTTAIYGNRLFASVEKKPYAWNTQQELEDLPTTWGGYDKFPMRAKFFHNTGLPIVAMSGKFHTSWGEFGGFKHPDALRYEAASMVAFGSACNFGDQMHPSGEMDPETYRGLGAAFAYVQRIEMYGVGGVPSATLGLWMPGDPADDEGVVRMLLEQQIDFAVVTSESDLSGFETIVLTGAACLTEADAARLTAFVAAGGALLVLGEGAMDMERTKFLLDVGASYVGKPSFVDDYMVAGSAVGDGVVTSPFYNYEAALRVKPAAGAVVLARIREPYFDRTYATYCSHLNTPYRLEDAQHPGVIRKGNVVFMAHRLGRIYLKNGARVHRTIFINALRLIHRKPMVETVLPSAGRVSLLHQSLRKRYVAHLLYGPPLQRGRCLVIEDLPALYQVPVVVRLPVQVKRARLIPDGVELPMKRSNGTVRVTVPEFSCHAAVVFEY